MDITIGMATEAVAVFDVTSESSSVTVTIINTMKSVLLRSIFDTIFPMSSAAPDSLMRVPSARPPANTYMRPHTIFPWILSQRMRRTPFSFTIRNAITAHIMKT